MQLYDVVIVGGGPAGLSAGIYAGRHGMNALILESVDPVSQMSTTPIVENYPGLIGSGMELLEKFREHAIKFGPEIRMDRVTDIIRTDGGFRVMGDKGSYDCRAVIIASGAGYKKLEVPGEKEFTGRGVSYCATCDAPFFRGKKVLVVGGGNTALTEAIYLRNQGVNPTIVHRRDEFRAEKILQEKVREMGIPIIWNSVVKEIRGEMKVEEVILLNRKTGEESKVRVDGIFIAIGNVPVTDFLKNLGVELNEEGYIVVDREQKTNVPGVFAAGDVCNNPLKQIVTACADGAIAAVSAFHYIKGSSEYE